MESGGDIGSAFLSFFAQVVGAPLCLEVPEDVGSIYRDRVVGSRAAIERPLFWSGERRAVDQLEVGYFLAGFAGHGANSHAFHYVFAEENWRVNFRIPFGGVYMDREETRADLVRFLGSYNEFRAGAQSVGIARFLGMEEFGGGTYFIELESGEKIQHERIDLVQTGDFAALLSSERSCKPFRRSFIVQD